MTRKETRAVIACLVAAGCVLACDKSSSDQASSVADESSATVSKLYLARCSTCHGERGAGDGAAALALNPKPRDFRDVEWQASVTDEQLAKIIVQGGAAVGKSSAMPPALDLGSKPKLLKQLIHHLRAMKH